MGSGSSTKRGRITTKVHIVAALNVRKKKTQKVEENIESGDESANDFIKRSSIRRNQHRMSYNDTSRAWKALDHTVNNRHEDLKATLSTKSDRFQRQVSITSAKETDKNSNQHREANPMHLYGAKRELKRDTECHICDASHDLKGKLHACRVCEKVFHRMCLEVKGFLCDDLAIEAVAESEEELGWSCPSCEDLFSLLSDSEKTQVIEAFDRIAGDDTSVDVSKYLHSKRESYRDLVGIEMSAQREGQEVKFFQEMDRNKSGTVEWWEYAPPMCIRILSRHKQEEILELATPCEIAKLESFFKKQDINGKGIVTLSRAKIAYGKWMLSLIKHESNGSIPNEWLGELPAEWLGSPKRGSLRRKEAEVTWQSFLLMNALHIICSRPNTVKTRPYLPTIDEAIHQVDEGEGNVEQVLCDIKEKEALKENEEDEEETIDPLERIKMRLKSKEQ